MSKYGFKPVRISKLDSACNRQSLSDVFILDTIGQLLFFYAVSDIVFIGGSLIKKGGHNILEPALFGRPILFGPHMFNFRDMSELFIKRSAARTIENSHDFFEQVRSLLNNFFELETMGKNARQLVLENQGAAARSVELICEYIDL